MSTTTATAGGIAGAMPRGLARRIVGAASAPFVAAFSALRRRQRNQAAIEHLRSMSDAELRDIGIARENIPSAVMGSPRDSLRLTTGLY